MDRLKKYILGFVKFSEEEFSEILPYFYHQQLKKGEYFYREGEICNRISFILSGMIRSFYHINEEEITRYVLLKEGFVTALSSFTARQPTKENLQALTQMDLLTIDHADLQYLYGKFPKMQELGRLIIEYSHRLLEERVVVLLSLSAEERYEALSDKRPELLQNVPLRYIASLLGIKPETLSRIRKKLTFRL